MGWEERYRKAKEIRGLMSKITFSGPVLQASAASSGGFIELAYKGKPIEIPATTASYGALLYGTTVTTSSALPPGILMYYANPTTMTYTVHFTDGTTREISQLDMLNENYDALRREGGGTAYPTTFEGEEHIW